MGDGVIAHMGRRIVIIDVEHLAELLGEHCPAQPEELERFGNECWCRFMGCAYPPPRFYLLEDKPYVVG